MAHQPPQPLGSKERSLFTQVVKNYESKQYKKGLKAADQILRKSPDHGDTIAMKALIINSQGNSEEAFALAKVALQKSMKSHVCWHVYGLLYRAVKNFEEAIKAYKFALKLEPESQQIQKDLALLQMQMRDYPGYVQSRRAMLQQRTQIRSNWTALAIAQHLAGDLVDAERTLTTWEETLKAPPPKTDMEHSEAALYKNSIIAEMGETERALEHLNSVGRDNPDRTSVMELRAQYLLMLGKKKEAEKAYRALLERNAEYRAYFEGLQASLELQDSDIGSLKSLYEEYAKKNPRGDAAKRIPLDFLQGEDFREAADQYLQHMLHKGIPSTLANVKALYSDTTKREAIQGLVEGYAAGKGTPQANGSAEKEANGHSNIFDQSVLYFLAQHYNYHLSRDLAKAMKYIDEALKLVPESVDYHMTKARIIKHQGNIQKAADVMEKARTFDTRDRYINTKAAKYQLRNNNNEAAIQNMSKFTRNEALGGPLGDLHDMQCVWYITEDGESYQRQGKLGLALKRYTSVSSIFEIWQEDQFDFHSFSLRKGQIRAYVDMIRWEDHLREHPFFSRAAIFAAKIYVMLFDSPDLARGALTNGFNGGKADNTERKKAEKKARKEKEKQEKLDSERKDAKKPAAVDHNGEPKKEDQDPKGEKLLQTSEPLAEAMKFINPLLEFSPNNIEAQQIAFEVFLRRKKCLLALRTLRASHALSPSNPTTHEQTFRFQHVISSLASPLPQKTMEVINSEFNILLPASTDLAENNNDFMQEHHTSAPHVQAGLRVRQLLDPSSIEKNQQDVIRTLALEGCSLEDAVGGLGYLKSSKAKAQYVDDYVAAAHERWPEATAFEQKIRSDQTGFAPLAIRSSSSSVSITPNSGTLHKPLPTRETNGSYSYKPDDLERAISSTRRNPRFKDIVNLAVQDDFHHELKRKLKEGGGRDGLEKFRKSQKELGEIKDKKIRAFYAQQNESLNDWLEVDNLVMSMADDVLDSMNPQDADGDGVAEHGGALKNTGGDIDPLLPEDEREKRRTGEKRAKWAININVIANVLLLIAKIIAAFAASSLSLIASLVDSALDLLCTLIIWTTNKLVQWKIRRLQHKLPVGRRRLEPLRILVFSIIMILSFLQILQESITKLLPGGPREAAALPPVGIGALVATVLVKGTIWIGYCKTDVVLNTLSLLFPLIGHQPDLWWLDPVGAVLLSLFIIYDWADTCFQNVARLTGSAVDERILKKVTFSRLALCPYSYHAGDGVWVEMDIMLDEKTRLSRVHDVAETLQYCLEGLSEVDRAFVSVDYTSQEPTGHAEG